MDFARKQLEKYGWTDGKGLGKNENGISQALKPKLKRSVAGVGHDHASEFNEHWWTKLYDKAANNVEVKESNGKTKKIKTKDDFIITNNMWQINGNCKKGSDGQYSDYFIRTAVMSGDSKTENVIDIELEEVVESKDVFRMTDEELFAACEGRTAHKGARHGLKAIGKLARIAQQEKLLLTHSKYNGYSHAKKKQEDIEKVVEDTTINTENVPSRKKKKKKKHCLFEDRNIDSEVKLIAVELENNNVASVEETVGRKKSKKKKFKDVSFSDPKENCLEIDSTVKEELENNIVPKKKSKKITHSVNVTDAADAIDAKKNSDVDLEEVIEEHFSDGNISEEIIDRKTSKKVEGGKKSVKHMKNEDIDSIAMVLVDSTEDIKVEVKIKKSKKKK